VFGGSLRRFAIGVAASVMALGAPASAQTYSDGYRFLQAIEKKDVNDADELLGKPGTTVINSRDLSNGRTALHIVVQRRDLPWVNYLTKRGANPNITDNRGVSPLMLAAQLGFGEGVEALVKARARVDEANDVGETALILAVHRRDTGMMRVLLGAGADPDRRDNAGKSARDYAKLEGASSITLAEIERSAKNSTARASGEVYGPSL
jgi:ankyrin repeat protein